MVVCRPPTVARWIAPGWSPDWDGPEGDEFAGATGAAGTAERRYVRAGVVAAIALPVIVSLDTITRRDGYDGSIHWISLLSHGHRGWIERLVLLSTGVLILLGGVGLGHQRGWPPRSLRWTARSAITLGSGIVLAAVFRIDVVPSYPVGSRHVPVSPAGVVHAVAGSLIVGALVAATVSGSGLLAGTDRRGVWRAWSLACATFVLVPMAVCTVKAAGAGGNWEVARAGTCQRVALFAGLGWLATAGGVVLRRNRPVVPLETARTD